MSRESAPDIIAASIRQIRQKARVLARSPLTVADLIEDSPVGGLQYRVFVLAALSLVVDGFDTQAVAYVAPVISKDWSLATGAFGPVFAAGLIGSALGSIALAPWADRFGRKRLLVASAAVVGLLTLLCSTAHSLSQLEALRFVTGVGLGAALPNALALISEYAPERKRTSIVTITFCGLALGAALGGVVASLLVPNFGWQSVFAAGGTATLLLVPVLQWKLPESLRFLVLRDPSGLQTLQTLRRFLGTRSSEHIELIAEEQTEQVRGWAPLFRGGRMVATVTYGCLAFLTLLTLYVLNNWLPTLIHAMGFDIRQASWSTAGFQLGGILGAIALGLLSDRLGAIRVVVVAYAAAATIIAALGAIHGPWLIALAAFGAGFTIVGAQSCNNAMVAGLYPTAARGKALGLNLTIGRLGSIVGPTVTGWLLLRHVPPERVLLWAGVPLAFAALVLLAATNSIKRLQERERRPQRYQTFG